jgi:hypothetical protein
VQFLGNFETNLQIPCGCYDAREEIPRCKQTA